MSLSLLCLPSLACVSQITRCCTPRICVSGRPPATAQRLWARAPAKTYAIGGLLGSLPGHACSSSSTPLPDSGCRHESHFPPPPPPPRHAHCPQVTRRRGRLRATRSPCSPSPAPLQARRPAALLLRAQAAPAPGERHTAASAAAPAAPPAAAQAPPPAEATFATADETVQIKPKTAADGSRFVWTRNWYPLVCAAGMEGMHGVHRWMRRRWGGKTCSARQADEPPGSGPAGAHRVPTAGWVIPPAWAPGRHRPASRPRVGGRARDGHAQLTCRRALSGQESGPQLHSRPRVG